MRMSDKYDEMARQLVRRTRHSAIVPQVKAIAAALRKVAQDERETCAVELESITQVKIPELFRNAGFFGANEKPDGWRDLNRDEQRLLKSIAAKIRKGE